jgi:DNA-binding transcriptional ArsR family regulator
MSLEGAQLEVMVEAMSHPLRSKLLFAVADKAGVTIRQIAGRLGESPRRVRHHLEALVEDGLIEVQDEVERRNTRERRYRVVHRPVIDGDATEALPVERRQEVALAVLTFMLSDARVAVANGTFGRHDGHCEVRFWTEVDEEGWDELASIHLKAFKEIGSCIAKIEERLAGGEASIPVSSALFLFEAPAWGPS